MTADYGFGSVVRFEYDDELVGGEIVGTPDVNRDMDDDQFLMPNATRSRTTPFR